MHPERPRAAMQLLERALPTIVTEILPHWSERFVIIVADIGDELKIGLLLRRQVLTFVQDMAHKLTDEQKHQFKTATMPGRAPVIVRAMRPEVPGEIRNEDIALLFVPATKRGHHGP